MEVVSGAVHFGAFEVDLRTEELRKHGLKLRLPRQSFQVLVLLLQHPGELVSREELREKLWSAETFVDFDHGLNASVNRLREALGDSAEQPQFIETLPRRGYRFIGSITAPSERPSVLKGLQAVGAAALALAVTTDAAVDGHPHASSGSFPFAEDSPKMIRGRRRLNSWVAVAVLSLFALGSLAILFTRWRNNTSAASGLVITPLPGLENALVAAVSPDGKYVAYKERGKGTSASLWIRHLPTGSITQLVPEQELSLLQLSFTPDGNYVHYTRLEPENVGQSTAVYEIPILGGIPKMLLDHVASGLAVSPDGKRWAYAVWDFSSSIFRLVVSDVGGSEVKILASRRGDEGSFGNEPAWSPDGRLIATTSDMEANGKHFSAIEIFPASGGPSRLIKIAERVRRVLWMPNGSGLVVIARDAAPKSPGQIWFQPYPEGAARQMTHDTDDYNEISITADGKTVVAAQEATFFTTWVATDLRFSEVSSNKDETVAGWLDNDHLLLVVRNQELFELNSDGSSRRLLFSDGKRIDNAAACGDGEHILFSRRTGSASELFRIDRKENRAVRIATNTLGMGDCSPDGKWVVFSRYVRPHASLWRAGIDGRGETELPQIDEESTDEIAQALLPSISPDGTHIAYINSLLSTTAGKPPMRWRICLIPSEGGANKMVGDSWFVPTRSSEVEDFQRMGPPRFSSDGKSIEYLKNTGGEHELWTQPLTGGPPHRIVNIPAETVEFFSWSPNGHKLVVAASRRYRNIVRIEGLVH
ncbi:MAG TPA: winged helix-turn-helix domain-containing protein [Terriglobales bacterium]|jgi:DNA-binding winged helix-turn-helix (wHTH) protein/Tol biopolymer transport system component|nr:winged helix-turn-helix domain-containing protein [Terriglobales bacterium]